jgi:hypothetical protein
MTIYSMSKGEGYNNFETQERAVPGTENEMAP